MATAATRNYRADIDGLRAVAVMAVVIYHAFPQLLPGGFVGVDIFFVISGFLISRIIYEMLEEGTFRLSEFYVRRIRRIFPALLLVVGVSILLGWFVLLPDEFKELGKHAIGGAAFVSNLVLWSEAGYFDRAAEAKLLLHLWSLGVEEQFYIFWPLALLIVWRQLPIKVLIFSLLVLSFLVNVYLVNDYRVAAFYSPLSRLWELLAGAFLAWYAVSRCHSRNNGSIVGGEKWINLLSSAGLALILLSLFGLRSDYVFPGWWALLPVVGSMLVIAAGPGAVLNRILLANPFVVWFGLISYPLYLWHWPLLTYARIIATEKPAAEVCLAIVLISVALAALTRRLVEQPLRFGSRGRVKAAALAAGMVAVGFLGAIVMLGNGYPGRGFLKSAAQGSLSLPEDVSMHNHENCSDGAQFPFRQMNRDFFCMQSKSESTVPTVAIVGDSHSYPLYFGFYGRVVNLIGARLLMVGAPGCPPIWEVESFEKGSKDVCRHLMNSLLERLRGDVAVKIIVLVSRGPLYVSGVGFGDVDVHNRVLRRAQQVTSESYAAIYEIGLEDTIRKMRAGGKKVLLVMSPPELGFEPRDCLRNRPVFLERFGRRNVENCSIDRQAYDARVGGDRKIVADLVERHPEVVVLDPAKSLCDGVNCRVILGSKFLYGDNNHLSPSGARLVVDSLSGVDLNSKLYPDRR